MYCQASLPVEHPSMRPMHINAPIITGMSAAAARRLSSLSPAFGHCYIMNSSSNIDPGSIWVGNSELGPSPIAIALLAVAISGLALRS